MVSPELLHAEPAQLVPLVAGRRGAEPGQIRDKFFSRARRSRCQIPAISRYLAWRL